MGSAWSSPAKQTGTAQNFSPQQMQAFNQFAKMGQQGGLPAAYDVQQSQIYNPLFSQISQQLNPYSSQAFNQQFQEAFANPMMRQYEQDILPAIRSQYYSPTASYGAGLNQAINQSAQHLTQNLGQLRAQYGMNQQQQGIANALGLLGQQQGGAQKYFSELFGASPNTAIVQGPTSGWARDLYTTSAEAAGRAMGALK